MYNKRCENIEIFIKNYNSEQESNNKKFYFSVCKKKILKIPSAKNTLLCISKEA